MTDEHTEGLLPVTQEDRQAAFDLFDQIPGTHGLSAHMLEGLADNSAAVQAFARHRSRHPSTPVPDGERLRERLIAFADTDKFEELWDDKTLSACGFWKACVRAALTKEDRNVTGG